MTIVVGVILCLVAVVSAAVVIGGAVWAARKDGKEDQATQERTGVRRKTRIGL
jgi:hypothetical protein